MPIAKINTMLFPGEKRRALTFSYDDGVIQDRKLVQLMKQYGIKGTFNLNTGLLGRKDDMEINGKRVDISTVSLEEVPVLYEDFEVATHGAQHLALTGLGSAGVSEILEDRKILENIVPYLVQGHAYPFGMYDEGVMDRLKAAGIMYARTVYSTNKFQLPENFLAWHPTCHHKDPDLMKLAADFCESEERFGQPRLFYIWGHAYEFDGDDNWEIIENFLAYISQFKDKIWMATNGEIVRYVQAYRSLVFSADGRKVYNPSGETVWMGSLGKIYKIPSSRQLSLL